MHAYTEVCGFHGVPIWIHYHQKEEARRLECESSVISTEKEKAYLHISALRDPALFHPVPLCRQPPLVSP